MYLRGVDDTGNVDFSANGEHRFAAFRTGGVDVGNGARATPASGELLETGAEDRGGGRKRQEDQEDGNARGNFVGAAGFK